MPSEFDTWFAESAAPSLLERLGETVTHYPEGVVAGAPEVTAIVNLMEPEVDRERGKGITTRGTFTVEDSLTLKETDAWGYGGKTFKTETIGDAKGGLVPVHVVHRKGITTTSEGRTVSGR